MQLDMFGGWQAKRKLTRSEINARYRARYPERELARQKKYREANAALLKEKSLAYERSHKRQRKVSKSAWIRTAAGRYSSAMGVAKAKGYAFTIGRELFAELMGKPCSYCGDALHETGLGLDRLDNDKGYTPDNVVQCCVDCNMARGRRFTADEMWAEIGPAIRRVKEARKHGRTLAS